MVSIERCSLNIVLQEIEMVISRLEEETASAKEETERAAEARVRCVLCPCVVTTFACVFGLGG